MSAVRQRRCNVALLGMLALLAGCGANGPPPGPPPANPDCSFRSGTSCWRLRPTLPSRSAQPADSEPPSRPPPAVLATRTF
jgi:hypothetical protein